MRNHMVLKFKREGKPWETIGFWPLNEKVNHEKPYGSDN